MVAIAHPQPTATFDLRRPACPASGHVAARPQLRLLQGGRATTAPSLVERLRPLLLTPAVLAAVGLLFLVVGVRAAQGTPPASGLQGQAAAEVAPVGSGEFTVVVEAGDTLWALADELAPGLDRRQVVAALAERNGGSSLVVGQALVVPAGLVDRSAE